MAIPPEYAWLVPIALPFIIGLLVGVLVKRTFKLIVAVVALVIVLIAAGFISLSFQDVYESAMRFLPRVISTGQGALDVLPYASGGFLVGLGLGLWKG